MWETLRKIAENAWLNLFVGLFLCYSGLNEAWGSLWYDMTTFDFGAHHGVIVLGLVNAFKSLPDILKGFETNK